MEIYHTDKERIFDIPNYKYLELLGEGGYGVVFKAIQESTDRAVAVKMVKFDPKIDETRKQQHLTRFDRETRICAGISHPNIVNLIDKGVSEEGSPFAVFEYLEGETLKEYIMRHKRLEPFKAKQLMSQVLDALSCAHEKGVVHRDLKPQNIMVTKSGGKEYVKVLDFGIGTFTSGSLLGAYQQITMTHDLVGTPIYSAPEQLRGEPSTVQSDYYAWGLIFLECLMGMPVMSGASLAQVFQKQLMATHVPLPSGLIDHPLGKLLRWVCAKRPMDRPKGIGDLINELEKINMDTVLVDLKRSRSQSLLEQEAPTLSNSMMWSGMNGVKKQLTVLCVKLDIDYEGSLSGGSMEVIDSILKDQINICRDIALRYGGFVSDSFMNNLAIYFGYPEVSDTDARRAGRTALELVNAARNRSVQLYDQHGIKVAIRLGMHSGHVLVSRNRLPEGAVPNLAMDMSYRAGNGMILTSGVSKKMLEPFLEFETHRNGEFLLMGERHSEAFISLNTTTGKNKMVGRDIEKKKALSEWNNYNDSFGILLEGQAGIGKSCLVHEIKAGLKSEGIVVLECRSLPEHENSALYPFLRLFRRAWQFDDLSENLDKFEKLRTELKNIGIEDDDKIMLMASWFSIVLPEGWEVKAFDPNDQKVILFDIFQRCLTRLESEKYMVVIEDLHWIDEMSLEFVNHMISNDEKKKLPFFLITSRPVEEGWLDELKIEKLKIDSMPSETIEALVTSQLDGEKVAQEALDYITERADGVPLYAKELTSMLIDQDLLVKPDSIYRLIDDIDDKMLPLTLQELLHSRLDRLGSAKETAQLASAIGREFDYDLLLKSGRKDEASLQMDLESLLKSDLIYQQRKVEGANYIFRHILIRDAAYDSMVDSHKVKVHIAIAEYIKKSNNSLETNQLVAYHYQLSGKINESVKYWWSCSEESFKIKQSYELTLFLIKKTICCLEMLSGSSLETQELWLKVLNLQNSIFQFSKGFTDDLIHENYKKSIDIIESNPRLDLKLTVETINGKLFYELNTGNIGFALESIRYLSNIDESKLDKKEALTLIFGRSYTHYLRANYKEVIELGEKAINLFNLDRLDDDYKDRSKVLPLVNALSFKMISLIFLGELGKSAKCVSTILMLVEKCGFQDLIANAYCQIASAYVIQGSFFSDSEKEYSQAKYYLDFAKKISEENDLEFIEHSCELIYMSFNVLDFKNDLRESFLKKIHNSGLMSFESWYMLFLIKANIDRKLFDKAVKMIQNEIQRCEKTGIFFALDYLKVFFVVAKMGNGQSVDSIEIEKLISYLERNNLIWLRLILAYHLKIYKGINFNLEEYFLVNNLNKVHFKNNNLFNKFF
ncbi:TOMM system kinase/cyclase fusion protein [Aureibacter tunicatorum]|uniref:TOMM system kinase/cyclase fusion protein n=1 Tax=Aureibacter tunicatorum TaxID=866807 RepID=A0AAE3XHA5_9BACT|nr:TOMM system kinase/cyclase fusion protein [Aureibacter tunicatorum]MDR6237651.1 TOMM system kinase/cyclase fusion protein [Aureibacter tunicatorum]BDD02686.1 hypothetical protein AUTU_01690 [Aureibacter tunicatorum]